jgi:hypothetical protein
VHTIVCESVCMPLDRRVGELLGITRTRDVVDAHVALLAHSEDTLLTSDPGDLSRLLDALAVAPLIVRV